MHKLCVLGVYQLLNVYDGLIVCTGMNWLNIFLIICNIFFCLFLPPCWNLPIFVTPPPGFNLKRVFQKLHIPHAICTHLKLTFCHLSCVPCKQIEQCIAIKTSDGGEIICENRPEHLFIGMLSYLFRNTKIKNFFI